MTQKVKIIDYDIIYLSYDEPNAEKNYADLLTKVPWAKRVHGVEVDPFPPFRSHLMLRPHRHLQTEYSRTNQGDIAAHNISQAKWKR